MSHPDTIITELDFELKVKWRNVTDEDGEPVTMTVDGSADSATVLGGMLNQLVFAAVNAFETPALYDALDMSERVIADWTTTKSNENGELVEVDLIGRVDEPWLLRLDGAITDHVEDGDRDDDDPLVFSNISIRSDACRTVALIDVGDPSTEPSWFMEVVDRALVKATVRSRSDYPSEPTIALTKLRVPGRRRRP